jgi:hypothetical protein
MTASAACPQRRYGRLVEAHFAGRISPAGEREMRGHLVICDWCRGYYDRHLRLARVDPVGARSPRDRLARGLGLSSAAPKPRWGMFAAAAAAACTLALAVGLHRRPDLQPRGTAPGSQLLVYQLAPGQTPRPVVSQIRADAGLAFAYANIAHKRRLMVFAVDDDRRVYWYHPAWQDPAQDPGAIEIAGDGALHEIPQAVTHHFTGRHLQLFGVFLDRAMSARQMEQLVAQAPGGRRLQLRVADANVTRMDLDLVPAP